MARKQFVSSKKNAPSRAVSSKEAAVQGRNSSVGDADTDDEPSMNDDGSRDSDLSSVASSPISSDEEGGDGSENGDVPVDPADSDNEHVPVTVQVMPASVGRGKQLRFPTGISRGKEVRSFINTSDREGSDSESYASLASDEEDEPNSGAEDDVSNATPSTIKDSAMTNLSPDLQSPHKLDPLDEDVAYPIKAFRARKRHRPDSGYFSQMSTHVRDCLLSVRDSANAAAVFRDDAHEEFRRKLRSGTVERVQWKQASPLPAGELGNASGHQLPGKESDQDKSRSRDRTKVEDKSSRKPVSELKVSTSPIRDSSGHKKSLSSSSSNIRERSVADYRKEKSHPKHLPTDSSDARHDSGEAGRPKQSSVETNGSGSTKNSPGNLETFVCSKCQSTSDGQVAGDLPTAVQQQRSSTHVEIPSTSFIINPGPIKDAASLQVLASKLVEEARSLKHEGNRRGKVDTGPAGQIAQGIYYLRSSAKFFQHALLLADLRLALKDAGDERGARSKFENCIIVLGQTTSLIRSTVGVFDAAGDRRLMALGYKLAAIAHLTIYRLQHQRLFAYYSDLSAPNRSPDVQANGSFQATAGSSSGIEAKHGQIKSLLVKEMEHTVRGFEMWQRYESLRMEVLPRITNPVIVDLETLFADLHEELDVADRETTSS